MPKSKNGLRINFDKIKRFLPIIVIVASFLYNLYKSKFKKDKELFIKKDGTFIKEGFSFYEVRRGSIGGTGSETKDKWVMVADINMKKEYTHKALTLELYPKRYGHGTTRQSFSVSLRNSKDKPMKPLVYSKIDYGKQGGVSFNDIKVLLYGDNKLDNRWEIWLKMGTSLVNDVPITWHLENIEENDKISIKSSTKENMAQNLPNVTMYGITKETQPVSELEEKVKKLEEEHVKLWKKSEETRAMAKDTKETLEKTRAMAKGTKEALGGVQKIIPQLTHYIQNIIHVLQRSGIGN